MVSLFYMWSQRRENLISQHKFYVEEWKRRITKQFSDSKILKKEANKYANKWLKNIENNIDETNADAGALEEVAYEKYIDFLMAFDQMGNHVRLSLIANMYHLWEKSLKEWLTSNDGIGYWYNGRVLYKEIWAANFNQLFELFESAGIFSDRSIKEEMDIIRLVVNTYKHGDGKSFNELKNKRKDLFCQDSVDFDKRINGEMNYIFYDDLYVSDGHVDEFSDAIIDFWRNIPDHIFYNDFSKIPKWFKKALDENINH